MSDVLIWYLFVTLLGWLTFPLARRLLPALADQGYAVSRTLGLLLCGYIFWLLASLGIVRNDSGGLALAFLLVLAASMWFLYKSGWKTFLVWLKQHWQTVLIVEVIFLTAFGFLVAVRAANPDVIGTEKPMELAFINAILHSPTFPPHDPWLSGYAISYYYFGYILVGMLAKLAGTPGGVTFNLGVSLVFALTAVGAYGMLYNLLADRQVKQKSFSSLLAPVMVLILGNWEGFLEMLHARGIFWSTNAAGGMSSAFWKWLDLVELSQPPSLPLSWFSQRYYWWWRASRVVQDYDLAGNLKEVIDEFPAFSYVLADLHPHVLAMPFAFLAMAVALNIFLGGGQAGAGPARLRLKLDRFHIDWNFGLEPLSLLLAALVLGGLSFLNTWDFPIYVALAAAAYAWWRWQIPRVGIDPGGEGKQPMGTLKSWLVDFVGMGFVLGVVGGVLYLPFYLGFSSQASGILPNLIYPTRGAQLWVMFGPFFLSLFGFLFILLSRRQRFIRKALLLIAGFLLVLWILDLLFGVLIPMIPTWGQVFLDSLAASNLGDLLRATLLRRLSAFAGWLTLALLLAGCLALWMSHWKRSRVENEPLEKSDLFVVLMISLGGLLVLVPEFFYLRDQFGWRINTIFKFYYQAWLLWGVAAAYAFLLFWQELGEGKKWVYGLLITAGVLAGFVYPVMGFWDAANGFKPAAGWNLDGTTFMARQSPEYMQAINWLEKAPPGVVAEAVSPSGGSYTEFARVAMLSGHPDVLGWVGHESQWRGGGEEMGSRQGDLTSLYCSKDWEETRSLIERYTIRYIFIGELERSTYSAGQAGCNSGLYEVKFDRYLERVFQSGGVTIYQVP